MPERPLLRLPDPEPVAPPSSNRRGGRIITPSRERQGERLEPRFARLTGILDDPARILQLRDNPASIAPERAIVFEVVGSLEDFYTQARALGFEYLGDHDVEVPPSDDFYRADRPERMLSGRVYLAMPDVRALQEFVSLYQRFRRRERMPKGRGEWRKLFSLVADIRPWGPQDRVLPETINYWQLSLEENPDRPVRFEAELWFYESEERRDRARRRLREEVERSGGEIVHHTVLPEIRYDAALIDLPPQQIRLLIDHPDVKLARVDDIMFLRPQSVAREPSREHLQGDVATQTAGTPDVLGREPIAALLDGMPIQNHTRLRGRLIVDDPDDLDAEYPVVRRAHGTAMASLIIHGDLNQPEEPIGRPLVVHPVMRPAPNGDEATPSDRLLVDVIYRAVRRIKEGDGDLPASAPDVVLINISLGDKWRPFAGVMSPLGRLLDYLAARYGILFIISAGNILDRITVPAYTTRTAFEDAPPDQRENAILDALFANRSQRSLYSPAEALNALTVGAAHSAVGYTGRLSSDLIDPFTTEELPNVVSAMGLGFRKVVKPEILLPGGRIPVRVVGSGGEVIIAPVRGQERLFGMRVAAPHPNGDPAYEDYAVGTSVAAALATRAGHLLYESLLTSAGFADLPADKMALVLKALLVHGAQGWGAKGAYLDQHLEPRGNGSHHQRRDDIARLLGYGTPDLQRVLDCTENRATLVGVGELNPDGAVLFRVPLPSDLEGVRAARSLTVTLAWFTPINPRHEGYRRASLRVDPASEERYWIASNRFAHQPTDTAVTRGTIFHERRVGEEASVFYDDGHLLLRVSCRATAGAFDDAVPFALAVSFEVGVEAAIPVYEQVRARLAIPVAAGVRGGA